MFRWYRRAALTIVHLLGIFSRSQQEGDLWKSIWNTRGWTYQEYVASKVVQFYTEDWKPYLDLKLFNHKESDIILSEMERVTQFTTEKLPTIEPGLDRVPEKLYLASKRQTTREEDIAYSLFGIFNVAIPIIYGEGNQAVGRLLEHILTRSDNVAILAWTGTSGNHHSYLPSDLTVYDQILPPHIPQCIESEKMDQMVTDLRSLFPDPSPIVTLYEKLFNVSSLSLISGRLRLPGLVFRLTGLPRLMAHGANSMFHIYSATAPILGEVRIETQRLILVHPWISPFLDDDFSGMILCLISTRVCCGSLFDFGNRLGPFYWPRESVGSTNALRQIVFIQVQIPAETSLDELMTSIGTVDVQ